MAVTIKKLLVMKIERGKEKELYSKAKTGKTSLVTSIRA